MQLAYVTLHIHACACTIQDHARIVQETWELVKDISPPLELGDKFFKVKITHMSQCSFEYTCLASVCDHMHAGVSRTLPKHVHSFYVLAMIQ
jgi:hypothetical protein